MRRLGLVCALLAVVHLGLLLIHRGGGAAGGPVRAPLRVGLVLDVGGLGDKSFNDAAYHGLERARRELGVYGELTEPGDGSDRESALRLFAARGFDLVIGVGFIFSDDMYAMAREYPKTRFACVDYAKFDAHGFVEPPPNMVALKFREEQGAFLVGALAALVSRTHVLGFVGGMDIPLIHKFEAGYRAGAAAVCPRCTVLGGYAGVTPEAFKNPSKGKELALTQYGSGADIIFHAAGSTGLGVFEAARATGHYAIGVDADQWDEAPGHVLTSMTKQMDVSVHATIRDLVAGKFTGGVRVFGLDAGGVDYVYDAHNQPLIPPGVRERVEALRREIIAGRIVVPTETGPAGESPAGK
ncbi:MAG TPA: BMP family ABC transporter substrate-binding protein [Polyangia bacterium]|jgi:basic membrane protein A|nr:BMP family ABC transporter substrate-binding protein [Polyangia bacterium]